nr:ABC transporter permease [Pectobacterium sp. IFB5596]
MTTVPLEKITFPLLRKRPFLRRHAFQPGLLLAWLVILTVALWALFPGWFTSYSPTEGIAGAQRLAPDADYWLGTDQLGRDLYARIVYGAVHSLSGAFIAVGLGLVLGSLFGLLAGAVGGWLDSVVMRSIDVLLAIPGLLLALSVIILLGFGTVNAAIAVGVTSVASFTRLVRSEVLRGVRLENGNYPTLRLYCVQQWRRMRDQQFINRDSFLLKRLNGSFYINRIPECYRRRM